MNTEQMKIMIDRHISKLTREEQEAYLRRLKQIRAVMLSAMARQAESEGKVQ